MLRYLVVFVMFVSKVLIVTNLVEWYKVAEFTVKYVTSLLNLTALLAGVISL